MRTGVEAGFKQGKVATRFVNGDQHTIKCRYCTYRNVHDRFPSLLYNTGCLHRGDAGSKPA